MRNLLAAFLALAMISVTTIGADEPHQPAKSRVSIVLASVGENGVLRIRQPAFQRGEGRNVETIEAYDTKGNKLDSKTLAKRLQIETMVLMIPAGEFDPSYLQILHENALVLVDQSDQHAVQPGTSKPTKVANGDGDIIHPGDRLVIEGSMEKGVYRVEPSGKVSLGIYRRVEVAGLTLEQAETKIQEYLHKVRPNSYVDLAVTRYDPLPRAGNGEDRESLKNAYAGWRRSCRQ